MSRHLPNREGLIRAGGRRARRAARRMSRSPPLPRPQPSPPHQDQHHGYQHQHRNTHGRRHLAGLTGWLPAADNTMTVFLHHHPGLDPITAGAAAYTVPLDPAGHLRHVSLLRRFTESAARRGHGINQLRAVSGRSAITTDTRARPRDD